MLTIVYNADGEAIPDSKLQQWAEKTIERHKSNGNVTLEVSTFSVINVVRLEVLRGGINHDDLRVRVEGENYYFNSKANFIRDGRPFPTDLVSWPEATSFLGDIISIQVERYRRRKHE